MFPGMFLQHSPECFTRLSPEYLATFPGMFGDIPRNVFQLSPKCFATFPGIFGDIPRKITFQHSPRSSHSVPRSCIPVSIQIKASNCLSKYSFHINSRLRTCHRRDLNSQYLNVASTELTL